MDSDARLDHVTIFEFAKMLGEGGMEKVNGVVLGLAKEYDLLDISTVMSDTTAQEAAVPYPNEVGLMGRFTELASRFVSRLRGKFDSVRSSVKKAANTVKGLVRAAHLFAKDKKAKNKAGRKVFAAVKAVHAEIDALIQDRLGHPEA